MDAGLSEEPKLLRKGLIVPDEVDKLFKIFFEKLNVCVPPSPLGLLFLHVRPAAHPQQVTVNILDPALHTPTTTFARCPLLFTVGACGTFIYPVPVLSLWLSVRSVLKILHCKKGAL